MICKWDGKTKIAEDNKDVFCGSCRKRYNMILNNIKGSTVWSGKRNITQKRALANENPGISTKGELDKLYLAETLVALASPHTGEIYESMGFFRSLLGFDRNDQVINLLEDMDVEIYPSVNRTFSINKNKPLLKVGNI